MARRELAIVTDVVDENDCGGKWTPSVISLALVAWPLSDEPPPAVGAGDTISLAVRNESEAAGMITIRASAESQRGAASAVLHRGAIAGLEEQEVAVSLDALGLPESGIDLLGQIVFVAAMDDGADATSSEILTIFFRPVDGVVELYDPAAKEQQVPDGAITDEGRAAVRAAVDSFAHTERRVGAPDALEPGEVSFAWEGPANLDAEAEGPPDDVAFDDQGGAR